MIHSPVWVQGLTAVFALASIVMLYRLNKRPAKSRRRHLNVVKR